MKIRFKKPSNKMLKISIVILVIILTIGIIFISYGYFRTSLSGTGSDIGDITLSTDCIDFEYVTEEAEFNLLEDNPITDETAKLANNYTTVTIKNNCSSNALNYVITLSTLPKKNVSVLADDFVRIYTEKDNSAIIKPNYLSSLANVKESPVLTNITNGLASYNSTYDTDNANNYIIDAGTISSSSTISYKVYPYIDYYEGNKQLYVNNYNNVIASTKDKTFSGIITIVANTNYTSLRAYVNNNKTITGVVTNNKYNLVSYCINSSREDTSNCSWISSTSTNFTTSSKSNGEYYLHIKDETNTIYHSNGVILSNPILEVSTPTGDEIKPSTSKDNTYTVDGLVTDPNGISGVTVNGNAATISGNTFTYDLTLTDSNPNLVTIIATNNLGNTTTIKRYVNKVTNHTVNLSIDSTMGTLDTNSIKVKTGEDAVFKILKRKNYRYTIKSISSDCSGATLDSTGVLTIPNVTSDKTCEIQLLAYYIITLDKNTGYGGSDSIYIFYGKKISLDSNGENIMTTSNNPLDIPDNNAYNITYNGNNEGATYTESPTLVTNGFETTSIFQGYYTSKTGGIQMIDSTGHITSNFRNTSFSNDTTLYAHYSEMPEGIKTITLPTITRENSLCRWAKDSTNGIQYKSGETITISSDMTLYAICIQTVANFDYTGSYVTYEAKFAGSYTLEVWGAQGGYRSSSSYGGLGGYSIGTINLSTPTTLYAYAGGSGNSGSCENNICVGGFNGGGYRYKYYGGGGASDIRIGSTSLYARVIVAGGGASDGSSSRGGGAGGGTNGIVPSTTSYGTCSSGYGTQTGVSGGNSYLATTQATTGLTSQTDTYAGFGFGGAGVYRSSGYGGAGGGGWYGGGGNYPDGSGDDDAGGRGGSGYVYTSDTAANYPSGCLLNSSYYLTNAAIYAGNTSFTGTSGESETGHAGNGYVRITYNSD